ncbi:MAG: LysE family translocator [Steroidobacteraceae bacterium]
MSSLGIHDPWLFLAAVVGLILTPGQDTMFIIGRSLAGGRRSGFAAAAGVAVGSMVHTLAAAFGLSVLLRTSATAFMVVKFAGAAYLIWLGVQLLRTKPSALSLEQGRRGTARQVFLQGILTNVLNPKVALFFLAFLPQFVSTAGGARPLAFLVLGATFIVLGSAWCCVLATAAASLQGVFEAKPRMRLVMNRVVGTLFVGLGARLAWAR